MEENLMRKRYFSCVIVAFCLLTASALWALESDVKELPACKYCGMNRETFAHSRMLVEYEDGTKVGLCSLHCAAVDLAANMGMKVKAIMVADYDTKQLIDAGNAVWVLGGKKQGVMTRRGKWAFSDKTAAEAFAKENGGVLIGFDDAMKAAYEDMWEDTRMIRERKTRAKMDAHSHQSAEQKTGH
jgi:copper chaperone NosL